MTDANLYSGVAQSGSLHLEIINLKLPGLTETYIDHHPGGAPVSIEVDVSYAKLESTFQLLGWNPGIASLVGAWQREQTMFFAYGLIRDRSSGEAFQAVASIIGRLGTADPQAFQRGESMLWKYAIKGIVYYSLSLAGKQLVLWDFLNNTFQIGETG